MSRIILLGQSFAAMKAVEKIRAEDSDVEICVLSFEKRVDAATPIFFAGVLVIILTTPPKAFEPYNGELAPFTTSVRSMSAILIRL